MLRLMHAGCPLAAAACYQPTRFRGDGDSDPVAAEDAGRLDTFISQNSVLNVNVILLQRVPAEEIERSACGPNCLLHTER